MPATIYNTTAHQGADWEDGINVTYQGGPLDVSGFTAKIQGRAEFGDASPRFTITEQDTSSGKITLGADGSVKWRLRASVTKDLEAPANIKYDLLLMAPDGSVLCPIEGILTLTPSATVL